MKIKVDEIKVKPVIVSAEEPVCDYPALASACDSGECEFTAPVKIDLTAAREYDHIRVDGHVETTARLRCSRCLEVYETRIASSFSLFYNKDSGAPLDDEIELREEELSTISYHGDYIDFTSELEDQLLMEVPFKPLCKEECKGLCGTCGANLNEGDCGCSRGGPDFRFGALKDFKINK
ncbi:MAG TPA: DUF177 domain-containing protein [Geobacteraceae bacterium]|nr:DUF177 domain-containing protein [Geobacteraceae bacterium]